MFNLSKIFTVLNKEIYVTLKFKNKIYLEFEIKKIYKYIIEVDTLRIYEITYAMFWLVEYEFFVLHFSVI